MLRMILAFTLLGSYLLAVTLTVIDVYKATMEGDDDIV